MLWKIFGKKVSHTLILIYIFLGFLILGYGTYCKPEGQESLYFIQMIGIFFLMDGILALIYKHLHKVPLYFRSKKGE